VIAALELEKRAGADTGFECGGELKNCAHLLAQGRYGGVNFWCSGLRGQCGEEGRKMKENTSVYFFVRSVIF
jgi:hypothetical protein